MSKKIKLLTLSLVVMAIVVALVVTTVLAATNGPVVSDSGKNSIQSCCDQDNQTQCNGSCGDCKGSQIGQCQSNNCSGSCNGQNGNCSGTCNGTGNTSTAGAKKGIGGRTGGCGGCAR